jgi:hypothetical protein
MKYAVEMGSGAMVYTPSFMKIGSGIQKLIGGGGEFTYPQTAFWSNNPSCIFFSK